MLAVYTGHEALTFPDYLDQGTGRTLTAVPGETYDVAPASGRLVPDIPQGWFTPVVTGTGGLTLGPLGFAGKAEVTEPDDDDAEPNGEPE